MTCAVERGDFPEWRGTARSEIVLARGQIEEAMGLIDGRWAGAPPRYLEADRLLHAYQALVRARDLCVRASALLAEAGAVRLALAHNATITAEEAAGG